MLQLLQTKWRNWRERRREYQVERALYKTGGHGDAGHGGFEGQIPKRPDDLSRIQADGGR